jgi:hypothetical protein
LKLSEKKDQEYSTLLTDASKSKAPKAPTSVAVTIRKDGVVRYYKFNDYQSLYQNWAPTYKLGLGILWACGSDAAKQYPIFSTTSNSVFAGHTGLLVPLGGHLFGETIEELLPSGKQGTVK